MAGASGTAAAAPGTPERPGPYVPPPAPSPGAIEPYATTGPGSFSRAASGPNLADLYGPAPAKSSGPDYGAMFQKSIGDARGAITQQLNAALQDIGTRQGTANQAIGMMPGQLNDIYGRGTTAMTQAAGTLNKAQQASGLQSFMGADAQMQPLMAAFAANQATRQADLPYLRMGSDTEFNRLRGQANAIGQSRQGSLDDSLAGFYSQMAGQQASEENAAQRDYTQHQYDVDRFLQSQADDNAAREAGFAHDYGMAQFNNDLRNGQDAQFQGGANEISGDRGKSVAFDPKVSQSIRDSKDYQSAIDMLKSDKAFQKNGNANEAITNWRKARKNKPRTLSLAIYDYLAAGGGQG